MTDNTAQIFEGAQDSARFLGEIKRTYESRKDLIVAHRDIQAHADGSVSVPRADIPGKPRTALTLAPTALSQMCQRLNIPGEYHKRLTAAHPGEASAQINAWLSDEPGRLALLRTLELPGSDKPRLRAVLSNKYRVIDNYDLTLELANAMREVHATVQKAVLTDDNLWIRAIIGDWQEEIPYVRKDGVREIDHAVPGVSLKNSETGRGGMEVNAFVFWKVCSNGMIGEASLRKIHLGEAQTAGYLSNETIGLQASAIYSEARDIIKSVFDRERFKAFAKSLTEAASDVIEDPRAAVGNVVERGGFTEADSDAIAAAFFGTQQGRDFLPTTYALTQAVTNRARDLWASDPDTAERMESAAYELVRVRK